MGLLALEGSHLLSLRGEKLAELSFSRKRLVFVKQLAENREVNLNGFGSGRFWLILFILLLLTRVGLAGFGISPALWRPGAKWVGGRVPQFVPLRCLGTACEFQSLVPACFQPTTLKWDNGEK
jgi:hypothetical protein